MLESSHNLISLRDIVRIGCRHKYRAATIFLVTLGSVAATAFLLPKQYRSEAKLFIRLGRTGVALDPTATVGQTVSTSDTRERELNSALEILKSRELLNDVVRQVGAAVIVKQRPRSTDSNTPSTNPSEAQLHKAIATLEQSLSRDVERNSNVITVSCTSRSPNLAQQILETYVQAFRIHHTRLNRTSGSRAFFEAEAAESAELLASAEDELRDAKNKIGVGSLAGEQNLIDERLTALQRDLISTRTSLAAANAKIASLIKRHSHLDLLTEATDSSVQDLASMRTELFKLEIHERELIAKLAASHPRVIAIKEQVVQARRLFDRQQLIGQKATARSLEVELANLKQQLDETKRLSLDLNESEIRIKKLVQRVAVLRDNFEKYQGNSEQARLDGAMASEQLSDVNIAQKPTFNPIPISPKKAMILILGFLAAVGGACGLTMVCEYFDDTFQHPEQVEASLELPVVLSVPSSRAQTLAV